MSSLAGTLDRGFLGSLGSSAACRMSRGLGIVTQAMLRAARDLGGEWSDALPNSLGLQSLRDSAARMAADAAASMRVMGLGVESTAARLELFYKMEAYLLVVRSSRTGSRATHRRVFEELLRRSCALRPRHALWVQAGLSYGWAESQLGRLPPEANAGGLLVDAELPEPALIVAHWGLGMALAERSFRGVRHDDPTAIRDAASRFVQLCRDQSVPGGAETAAESLGLVLRCIYPDLVGPVADALRDLDTGEPPLTAIDRDVYWAGVGRALYFLPVHLLPGYGTLDATLRRLARETSDVFSRRGGRRGVAFAATLISLREPLVLERFVVRRPETVDRDFIEGVASAVRLRLAMAADSDDDVAGFFAHRPYSPQDREPWQRRLIAPLGEVLRGRQEVDEAGGDDVATERESGL